MNDKQKTAIGIEYLDKFLLALMDISYGTNNEHGAIEGLAMAINGNEGAGKNCLSDALNGAGSAISEHGSLTLDGLYEVSKSIGKLASAVENVASALKSQQDRQ
jgi:hypothetical protein